MNLEQIQQITAKVSREGELPPEGRYVAETANFLEVKLTKKGAKALSFGVMLKSDAKSGTDVSGYAMQRVNVWAVSGTTSGVSSKTGKAYSIDNGARLAETFARIGFSSDEIVALFTAIEAASPTSDENVRLFGEGSPAIRLENGDILSFKGRTLIASIKHDEYNGRTNANVDVQKYIESK
jgi:hypothetical protein